MNLRTMLALAFSATLAACATTVDKASPEAPPVPPAPVSAFEKAIVRERIIVAGQPTLEDLKSLSERGIVHVFNVRSAEEMDPALIGFDEAAELAKLGVGYSNHPISAAASYTPELLAAFAKQVEASSGKVLLHCTVGSRASQIYAAYAMKHLGLSPDEAIRTMEPVGNWPLALERLTGEPLALVRRDAFIKAGFED
jgi:uncharacterized protein (TIGR01244 family)